MSNELVDAMTQMREQEAIDLATKMLDERPGSVENFRALP